MTTQTKNALKLISTKGKHNYFKFGDGNDKWTKFKEVEHGKTNPKKKRP